VRRPGDELQQVERNILSSPGPDVSFNSQCILHVSQANSDAIDPARRAQIGYKHLVSGTNSKSVVVMGSYVADLAFRTPKLPAWGETSMGSGFQLGPGGKGSNQAVAAARAGAPVSFISKIGNDSFGEMARAMWKNEGIDPSEVSSTATATGAAAIILDQSSGENAIIVVPGACYELSPKDVDGARPVIERAAVFMTQLELPLATVQYGLELAHSLGLTTILNPAPACTLPDAIYTHCDFVTPNETEAEFLTGVRVQSLSDAERAADAFLARGARNAIITLGARGALVKNHQTTRHVEALDAGPVVETTGAGDAFNGGLAAALAEGRDLLDATRFACAVASISVTRPGTAPSMPHRAEVDALLAT
jgi:ribokinase